MTTNITITQAAEILGLTPTRVAQLVSAGTLAGERFGKMWMLDASTVAEFKKIKRRRGRPRKPKD